ncbi:MerR family transcriptional regulator [Pseudarthrobacter sp. O4]|uniref:MerR family transcriptional regulator n=1 Tax=Pseudarthrobacter sp. O4 TaxID=3418417 RepID=UPI003CEC0D17
MTVIEPENYTVGQAAQIASTTRKAIRIYESKGLLPTPGRTEAGYRLFTAEDIEVLRFIRQAKSLGLRLAEIGDILDLQRGGAQPCEYVIRLLDAHLAQIEKTLGELRQLRGTLRSARRAAGQARLSGGDAVICRIIETPQPGARPMLPLRPRPVTANRPI